jgi:hypothetical protein
MDAGMGEGMNATTPAHARDLTDWFPADVKPVRIGVYETSFAYGGGFSEWNGYHWSNQYDTPQRAKDMAYFAGEQDKCWRGLTEPA